MEELLGLLNKEAYTTLSHLPLGFDEGIFIVQTKLSCFISVHLFQVMNVSIFFMLPKGGIII